MNGTALEAPTIGIGRFLKEGTRFFVPHHQRDFSWTEDEIDQLFTDIEEARTSGQTEYFIGLMVFIRRGQHELTILDGQQRLATSLIILSAVRRWLKERGYDQDANQIQAEYIAVRELGREEQEARLILNEINNPLFENYVINEAPSVDIERYLNHLKRYDPNRRLLEAVLFCRSRIDNLAGATNRDSSDGSRKLFDLVNFLRDGVKIVRLTVSNEANAYTVFETLNDRGLDLTVLDLIKNHLFGKTGSAVRLSEIKVLWTQMMANLASVRADDFLKAWWTSRYGRVQKAQLFPQFRRKLNDWSAVAKTSADLLSASEQYAALEISDDPLWAEISPEARASVRTLKLLGGRQVHPVLLSALDKFAVRELERLLWLLEVLIVRYQLIGGGRTGRLEITCASLAYQIFTGKVKSTTQARQAVKDIFPNDQEFRESFNTKQEKNNQKVFYLLSALEAQARKKEHDDMKAIELKPSGKLTVEHVFPKRPGKNWDSLLQKNDAFAEDGTYRLGNLCLLTKVNRSLGNKAFEEKKKVFAKSDLILTRDLGNFTTWNRDSVEKRQTAMAKMALAVWRFQ